MSPRAPRQSFWRDGPAKWIFTAYGILLATAHLAAAGFDVGRFFDLFEIAWPFYASLIAITSTAAVVIHRRAKTSSLAAGIAAAMGAPAPDSYTPPGALEEEESSNLPRAPR